MHAVKLSVISRVVFVFYSWGMSWTVTNTSLIFQKLVKICISLPVRKVSFQLSKVWGLHVSKSAAATLSTTNR